MLSPLQIVDLGRENQALRESQATVRPCTHSVVICTSLACLLPEDPLKKVLARPGRSTSICT